MDDNEQTGEIDPSAAGRTEEYPTMEYPPTASTLTTTTPLEGDGLAFEQLDDENDEWLSTGPARGIRLAVPIAGLLAVLLVGAGFWGGVALEEKPWRQLQRSSSRGLRVPGQSSRCRRRRLLVRWRRRECRLFRDGGDDLRRRRKHALHPQLDRRTRKGLTEQGDDHHP